MCGLPRREELPWRSGGRRLDCLAGLLAGRLGLSRRAAGEMALILLGNMEQKSLEEALREFSTEYF